MSAQETPFPLSAGDCLPLVELAYQVLAANRLEDLPDSILPLLG
jgi:hypothetical protein